MAPTHRVEHALEVCPECGTGLVGGLVQRTREVTEIPVVPVQETEHVLVARVCPMCEQRRVPKADLKDVVVGRQRLGINLVKPANFDDFRRMMRDLKFYWLVWNQLP